MVENTGKTGRVDRAAICLREWIERGRGYHTLTWDQWAKDTQAALDRHNQDRALVRGLISVTRRALLDYDLDKIDAKLAELERLFE